MVKNFPYFYFPYLSQKIKIYSFLIYFLKWTILEVGFCFREFISNLFDLLDGHGPPKKPPMLLDFRKLLASADPQAEGQSGDVAGPSTPQSVEELPIGNRPPPQSPFQELCQRIGSPQYVS